MRRGADVLPRESEHQTQWALSKLILELRHLR